MHAKPDLRVFLKWMIYRSGSVITDVITLGQSKQFAFSNPLARRSNTNGHIALARRRTRSGERTLDRLFPHPIASCCMGEILRGIRRLDHLQLSAVRDLL